MFYGNKLPTNSHTLVINCRLKIVLIIFNNSIFYINLLLILKIVLLLLILLIIIIRVGCVDCGSIYNALFFGCWL